MVQHRAIITMAEEYEVVYDLLNGAIFNDLEQPLPSVSRSLHFWSWITQKWYEIQTQFQC